MLQGRHEDAFGDGGGDVGMDEMIWDFEALVIL